MRTTWIIPGLLVGAALLAGGCGASKRGLTLNEDPRIDYSKARRLLDEGKCTDAREILRMLSLEKAGVTYIDSIVYDLARAYTCEGDHALAKVEYERVVNSYPQSALVDDAAFGLAMSQYRQAPRNPGLDQQDTERAGASLKDFIAIYPRSDRRREADSVLSIINGRLAHKTFDSGRLYLKLGADSAAMIYFQKLWDEYTQSPYAARALWLLADKARKDEDWDLAIKRYEQLIAVYPNAIEVPRARVFLERIRSARAHNLFHDAEEARANGDWKSALDLYQQLVTDYPEDRHVGEARQKAEEMRRALAGDDRPAVGGP
jgi:outer membrane protein assembly factor BamD